MCNGPSVGQASIERGDRGGAVTEGGEVWPGGGGAHGAVLVEGLYGGWSTVWYDHDPDSGAVGDGSGGGCTDLIYF